MGSDDDRDRSKRRERRLGQLALVLVVTTPVMLLWAWSRPIAAPPTEMPPLTLAPNSVRTQIADDERLAAAEPDSEEAAERRRRYQAANVGEYDAADFPGEARERVWRLMAATNGLVEEHGEEVIAQLRAADVARAERALRGELAAGDAISELGGFLRMMERYGMAAGGQQLAPRFVVRTAFAARWNAMHGRDLTDGFSDVERRAYWGWLALHAVDAPMDLRMEAIEHYEAASGERADEARGVLLYDYEDMPAAEEAFVTAYQERGAFRLRNHALAAAAAEGTYPEETQ